MHRRQKERRTGKSLRETGGRVVCPGLLCSQMFPKREAHSWAQSKPQQPQDFLSYQVSTLLSAVVSTSVKPFNLCKTISSGCSQEAPVALPGRSPNLQAISYHGAPRQCLGAEVPRSFTFWCCSPSAAISNESCSCEVLLSAHTTACCHCTLRYCCCTQPWFLKTSPFP